VTKRGSESGAAVTGEIVPRLDGEPPFCRDGAAYPVDLTVRVMFS